MLRLTIGGGSRDVCHWVSRDVTHGTSQETPPPRHANRGREQSILSPVGVETRHVDSQSGRSNKPEITLKARGRLDS